MGEHIGWSNDEDEAPPLYRLKMLERGQATQESRIAQNTSELNKLWTEIRVMKTRVGIYAAIGAGVGGIVAAVIAEALVKHGGG